MHDVDAQSGFGAGVNDAGMKDWKTFKPVKQGKSTEQGGYAFIVITEK